jgi:hypothetical protein
MKTTLLILLMGATAAFAETHIAVGVHIGGGPVIYRSALPNAYVYASGYDADDYRWAPGYGAGPYHGYRNEKEWRKELKRREKEREREMRRYQKERERQEREWRKSGRDRYDYQHRGRDYDRDYDRNYDRDRRW